MHEKPVSSIIRTVMRVLPMAMLVIIPTIYMIRGGLKEIQNFLSLASAHSFTTFLIIISLYCIKSFSLGIPFVFLYAVTGSMYPLGWALLINIVGIFMNLQIPYILARRTNGKIIEKLADRYEYIRHLEKVSSGSGFLISFMIKFIGKIPHELTNALLGALKIPYFQYVTGSLLGLAPIMAVTTVAGNMSSEPSSFGFIASAAVVVLLTIISYFMYKRQRCAM